MTRLQYTINDGLKNEAEMFLRDQGLTPNVAINMFYVEIVKKKGLPFKPSKANVPNKVTTKVIQDARKGKNIIECQDANDMFDKLGI